jgi:hypothetical protein
MNSPFADRIRALSKSDAVKRDSFAEVIDSQRSQLITLASRLGQPALFDEDLRNDDVEGVIAQLIVELEAVLDAVDEMEK